MIAWTLTRKTTWSWILKYLTTTISIPLNLKVKWNCSRELKNKLGSDALKTPMLTNCWFCIHCSKFSCTWSSRPLRSSSGYYFWCKWSWLALWLQAEWYSFNSHLAPIWLPVDHVSQIDISSLTELHYAQIMKETHLKTISLRNQNWYVKRVS